MKLIKNIASGLVLGFGVIILMAAAYAPFNSSNSQKEKTEEFWACLIFGLPITTWGVWLRRGLKADQPQEGDRLRTLFFQLLQESQGRITVLRFAMASGLPGDQAKVFLDERAKEFDATFDVDGTGGVSYCFNLGTPTIAPSHNPTPTPGATYDVVLEEVPSQLKIAAIKIVRELTQLGLKEAKDLVEQLPQVIQRSVAWEAAEATRRQLESEGLRARISATLGKN